MLGQAAAETSLRRQLMQFIAGTLKSDVPNFFKLYVVVLLFIGVCISCDMMVFSIDEAVTFFRGPPPLINPAFCLIGIAACAVMGVGPAVPLTMRMAAFEEARQLQTRLEGVQRAKRRRENKQVGEENADS